MRYSSYYQGIKEAKEIGNETLAWKLVCEAECEKAIEVRNCHSAEELEKIHEAHRDFLRSIGYY